MSIKERKFKLSASALSTYLKSPKQFYWRYIARLDSAQPSVTTFDHDKIVGVLWAEFVHRFYNNVNESENHKQLLQDWNDQTEGWVPEKAKSRLTSALEAWATTYYQLFNQDDGVRGKDKSELFVENDRFLGYLDGLSDEGVVHEVKSTSRSPQLAGQLWKVQNSIQVKLYCVLTNATGIRIEFAFKDSPFGIYRSEVLDVTKDQLKGWEKELNTLADHIYSLGDDYNKYPCNPDGCCIVTKGITSMCAYETLCDMGLNEVTRIAFKEKSRREKK